MEIRTFNLDPGLRIDRSGQSLTSKVPQNSSGRAGNGSFEKALLEARQRLTFSKHAEERLKSMEATLDGEKLEKLEKAVDLAQSKGARSTLVLMKDVAFVVAPDSRTVVTVIPENRMKENVFTSIDSAVLADK